MPYTLKHPKNAMSSLRRFFYDAFILPFKDPARGYIYFTSFFFAFGFAFLDIFLALDIGALGARELTNFMVAKLGGISVIIPIALLLIGRVSDKVLYPALLLVTATGLFHHFLADSPASALQLGLFYACAVSPFWAMYHAMFASVTSDSNIGNEVSLAGTGMTIGMTFGSVLGGFFSQMELDSASVIIGFSIIITSALALILKAFKTGFSNALKETGAMDESLIDALKRCKFRSVGSFLEGLMQPPTSNLWIVYLSLAGIGAAAVGIWQAIMVLVKVVVTPLAGSLVNHGRRREMMLGAGLNMLGWTPFLYGVTSFFVLIFMNIWAVGLQLFSTGLTSAWYGSRTVSAIIVREMLMGVARVGATFVMVPLLYASPQNFINTIMVISALMCVYAALWMRSLKSKGGPVLPIESIVDNKR